MYYFIIIIFENNDERGHLFRSVYISQIGIQI